eukprot:scaffold4003_cov165-Amphora_coffeaeformis.AAC.12
MQIVVEAHGHVARWSVPINQIFAHVDVLPNSILGGYSGLDLVVTSLAIENGHEEAAPESDNEKFAGLFPLGDDEADDDRRTGAAEHSNDRCHLDSDSPLVCRLRMDSSSSVARSPHVDVIRKYS